MACLARLHCLQACRRSFFQMMKKRSYSTAESKVAKNVADIKYEAPKKVWVSYGFSNYSEEIDRHGMHQTFFVAITLCIVVGGFLLTYAPDLSLHDWSQREAYLQLRRKEELGLDPIDPNFVDPARIVLPTDEELGDTEIII